MTKPTAFRFVLALAAALPAAAAAQSPVVVELFTSQGCASCPPADALLGELAGREDVLALSFHVNYWDRLGWPDTFATEAGTLRQHNYARAFHNRGVYTPQIVVDGRREVVGSRRDEVLQAVAAERAAEVPELRVEREGRMAFIHLPAGPAEPCTVWLVPFDERHEVAVDAGENDGRRLVYYNVARDLERVATYTGEAQTIEVPLGAYADAGRDGVAVLVQREADGAIVTAAALELDG